MLHINANPPTRERFTGGLFKPNFGVLPFDRKYEYICSNDNLIDISIINKYVADTNLSKLNLTVQPYDPYLKKK